MSEIKRAIAVSIKQFFKSLLNILITCLLLGAANFIICIASINCQLENISNKKDYSTNEIQCNSYNSNVIKYEKRMDILPHYAYNVFYDNPDRDKLVSFYLNLSGGIVVFLFEVITVLFIFYKIISFCVKWVQKNSEEKGIPIIEKK